MQVCRLLLLYIAVSFDRYGEIFLRFMLQLKINCLDDEIGKFLVRLVCGGRMVFWDRWID